MKMYENIIHSYENDILIRRMRMAFSYENVVAAYENDILTRPRMSCILIRQLIRELTYENV